MSCCFWCSSPVFSHYCVCFGWGAALLGIVDPLLRVLNGFCASLPYFLRGDECSCRFFLKLWCVGPPPPGGWVFFFPPPYMSETVFWNPFLGGNIWGLYFRGVSPNYQSVRFAPIPSIGWGIPLIYPCLAPK